MRDGSILSTMSLTPRSKRLRSERFFTQPRGLTAIAHPFSRPAISQSTMSGSPRRRGMQGEPDRNQRRGDKAVATNEGHVVLRIKTRALDHIGVKRITWMLELTHLLTRRNTAFLSSSVQGISFERRPVDASRAPADYKLPAGAQKVISSPLRYTCHDLLKVVEK